MGMGLIQDKTTEYLQELLAPFDKPVDCNNINLYFNTPQRRKLPPPHILCREHPDFFDQKGIEFLPDVMVAVGNAMELYKARNNKMNDFTTTNKKKVRPDVLVYCRDVLVIMGEEKAANSTLATAAADLDYYFKFWTMLAFVESSTTPKRERIGGVLSLGTEVKRNNYLAIKYYSDY
ncbi:kinase-like domain-containing protein [Rhizophagus irregularis DAOM 181602=DAOM 197198]|uniref:Crinkler family protein n=3 Tax=Rhizophagus irregularis TaxID=588596 RepID=A0A2P4PXU3_RHIID|nr:hypothetical protein GLOIN_2v1776116 [Rhizophagus irregularis DAOM 181602=DAOM 197198]POG70203.1 hypothetical protein GLOIN_2v1776116 [Rhizophagus irregularis DAOM 181602=DAOM 197198]GBC28920.2 kinase-like domain-containing protein [Rhizophagus irregularis DAOM 181602=DAOM 197198]|eukprot:XP_025177069.1 hypothetical protein GLOIN_2v1776116 [Rhizophagus irregularis DAOM 181602=DAOM 197198]